VRRTAAVGAVAAALVGVAAAARPAWGLFSGSAASAQSVKAAALPSPAPSAAGPVWVGGGWNVTALAGSAASEDVVAATNVGSSDSVTAWSPKGQVWTAPVSSVQSAVALDATDGTVVTAGRDPTAVTVLSAQTGAVQRTVPLPTGANWQSAVLATDSATGTVWTVLFGVAPPYYEQTAEALPLDPSTGQFGTPIALPQPDQPAAAAWGDGELVLANSNDGIVFVNTSTGSTTNVALPGEPAGVAASPTGVVAATLPYTNGGEVALLSSPSSSPDIVPASGVGEGVAWDGSAGEFAAATSNGTLFVGTGGQETLLTWPTFAASGGPSPSGEDVAPVAGGVTEDSSAGGVAFVASSLADVGAGSVVVSTGDGGAEPPDATCEVLAGPSSAGPWASVGSEPCPGTSNYPPLAVEVPSGDTWFAVRASVGAWQSPQTAATEWSVPDTAGTGA